MIGVYIICAKTEVEQARGEKSSVHDELALEKDEYVGGMDGDFANNYDDVGFAMEEDNGAGIGGGLDQRRLRGCGPRCVCSDGRLHGDERRCAYQDQNCKPTYATSFRHPLEPALRINETKIPTLEHLDWKRP